jgi:hypothetical protein
MKITEDFLWSVIDDGRALDDEERSAAIDEAAGFEECNYTKDELDAMIDVDLCRAVYSIWCDYASGQI